MFYRGIIEKLLPKSFAPLLQLVGPSFFEVVPWQELSRNGRQLLQHFGGGNRDQRMLMEEKLEALLCEANIDLKVRSSDSEISPNKWSSNQQTSIEKQRMGELVLQLYFLQLKNDRGLFLDLRPTRFDLEQSGFIFKTSTVWIHLNEDFRRALVDLYTGFYSEDNHRFKAGLAGAGLIQEQMTSEQKAEMTKIFLLHFGEGDQARVKFQTKDFINSFESIFKFMLKHKLKIPGEFLYLGIYLAGLYSNLEKLDIELNVRGAFEKVF